MLTLGTILAGHHLFFPRVEESHCQKLPNSFQLANAVYLEEILVAGYVKLASFTVDWPPLPEDRVPISEQI